TLAALATGPRTAAAAGPPKDWEKWVPESATAVLAIDVEALHRSPLATREGWAGRHVDGTPTDVTSLPGGVSALVIASDLSPRTRPRPCGRRSPTAGPRSSPRWT